MKSDEKPSIPVYVVRKHASGCGQCNSENLLIHVLTHPAQCPIFTAGPISRCTLPPCTLHIAPCTLDLAHCILHIVPCTLHIAHCTLHSSSLHLAHCTLHLAHCTLHIATSTTWSILHITRLPPRLSASTRALYTKYSTAFPQLLSTLHCRALVGTGILIKALLRPFSNRKLNSPPPSQLNKKTRNTKRLKTTKVLLNCRMGNLFCRLHNIESPTSNKGGQRTLNIA